MLTVIRRGSAPILLGALMMAALALPALAEERINKNSENVAIRGYDTVAYFTEGRAVKGKPEFEHVWQEAKWLFATAEHRDLFAADPERYAPRFGGFCTGGLSLGYMTQANPENWSIIDGRLYMNRSRPGRDRLRADPAPIIAAAEGTWTKFERGFAEGTGGHLGGELPLAAEAASGEQASKSSF
jgi:hypothetical protein